MKTNTFLGGLLAGAVLGIAGGLLLATSTSGETKDKLVKGAKKIAGSLGDTVNDTIDELKGQYNEGIEQVAEKGKETIRRYSEKGKF